MNTNEMIVAYIKDACIENMQNMASIHMQENSCSFTIEREQVIVIINLLGEIPGSVMFQVEINLAQEMAKRIMEEEEFSQKDLCLIMAEFMNTFCGLAVTKINGKEIGIEMRISYPFSMMGSQLHHYIPYQYTKAMFFENEFGQCQLSIALEEE